MTKQTVAKKSTTSKHGIGKSVPPTAEKILNVCAVMKILQKKDSVERKRLSALTGIGGQSTIGKGLTYLKNREWLDVHPKEVSITEEGMQHAKTDDIDMGDLPTTNDGHRENMKKMHKLKPKACELLDLIADGKTYDKKEIAELMGMKMNSTFGKVLTALKQANLAEVETKTIRLADDMFPIEPRAED